MSIRLTARTWHENAGEGISSEGPRVEREGIQSERMVLFISVLRQKRTMYTTLLCWTLIRRRKGKRVDNVRASSKIEPQP